MRMRVRWNIDVEADTPAAAAARAVAAQINGEKGATVYEVLGEDGRRVDVDVAHVRHGQEAVGQIGKPVAAPLFARQAPFNECLVVQNTVGQLVARVDGCIFFTTEQKNATAITLAHRYNLHEPLVNALDGLLVGKPSSESAARIVLAEAAGRNGSQRG